MIFDLSWRSTTGASSPLSRKNGGAQMSILSTGLYQESVVFVVAGNTAKLANLKRNPRCTVLAVKADWSGYAVIEGNAKISSGDNMDPEALRLLLRNAYRACGGGEHPDWNEYDEVMKQERRAVVMVTPERMYGMWR